MLELRYFVSTYFTDFALVLAARELTSGLYNKDNLNELHFILNARTTRINEWLENNPGHEDTQELKLELRYHRDFLRTTLTTRFTNPATAFGWSSLHMSYNGAAIPGSSTRYVTARTSVHDSPSTTAMSRRSTSPTETVSSSARHGQHTYATSVSSASTTSSTRGARQPRLLGPRLPSSAERFRLLLMEKTGLRTNYDAGPPTQPSSPTITHTMLHSEPHVRGVHSPSPATATRGARDRGDRSQATASRGARDRGDTDGLQR